MSDRLPKITYKEAAEIIKTAAELWNCLSNNYDLSAMTDHCHAEYDEVLYIASKWVAKVLRSF